MIDITPVQWMDNAACAGMRDDLFFPIRWDSMEGRLALTFCNYCDVRDECLQYALDQGIYEGIWGGTTGAQRQGMREQQRQRVSSVYGKQVEHGTTAGARWERRQGLRPCPECRKAERERMNELRREQSGRRVENGLPAR